MNDNNKKHLVVLGAGPGGYPAAFHAADLGMDVTLIDVNKNPGGVCLYVGCIPSKTLLHAAKVVYETQEAKEFGLDFGEPKIDLDKLRSFSERVVGKLTGGLGALSKQRKVNFLQGRAGFTGPNTLNVNLVDGGVEEVEFDYAIIATGSTPTQIPALSLDSDRVMDSSDALGLPDIPDNMLVIGGGYIGLELGTVYASLGTKVSVVEMTSGLLPGADRDLVQLLHKRLEGLFEEILLDTKVMELEEIEKGIKVKLSGPDLDNPERTYDRVLIAIGRKPNARNIGLENTSIEVDDQGFIQTDNQRRTAESHIYAIGDVAGQPMLAHKATFEARIAVEAIAGEPSSYDPSAIPAVVFTDPEVAWAGLTETEALDRNVPVKIARFPWQASGKATTLDRNDGLTKMVLEPVTERILGIGIAGVSAGELINEAVLAIEMGARADDVKMTIHAHPTLSETVMEAAEVFFNTSTHYKSRDGS